MRNLQHPGGFSNSTHLSVAVSFCRSVLALLGTHHTPDPAAFSESGLLPGVLSPPG